MLLLGKTKGSVSLGKRLTKGSGSLGKSLMLVKKSLMLVKLRSILVKLISMTCEFSMIGGRVITIV